MKIYILRVFPTAHKWYPDSSVIGYFTNKTALQKAIAQNWATLGGYQKRDFCREFYNRFYRNDIFSKPDQYLECGVIEVVNANEF